MKFACEGYYRQILLVSGRITLEWDISRGGKSNMPLARRAPVPPDVIRESARKIDKHHLTGKLTELIRQLIRAASQEGARLTRPQARALHSAADMESYSRAGIEVTRHCAAGQGMAGNLEKKAPLKSGTLFSVGIGAAARSVVSHCWARKENRDKPYAVSRCNELGKPKCLAAETWPYVRALSSRRHACGLHCLAN
ncbi:MULTISPECIES: hypothetical protein [Xanthomonas]|uniref:hypothetical protein n=1 Tax=Xanthomonas TaxID=338 RepID=UPI0011B0CC12|nr:hypothetical protein [Xanthomonas arboricola]